MDIYKQASRDSLRFTTSKGSLSVEQLWSLNQTELSTCVKNVKKILKKSNDDDELSFLDDSLVVDKENQLRFDILKDIYLTKKKENEDARDQAERKAQKQKILSVLQEKKEGALKEKSIEELEAMLES